jgi:hypothetical protein
VPDVEDEIDALYALPREEFVPARNELAKRLRRDGDAEAAETVRALAKPTVAADVLNRLVREQPKLVRALAAAGDELRAAQERTLRGEGGGDELREASAAQRRAVRALVEAAPEASAATRDEVRAGLEAAAVDDDARALLERGRFSKPPDPPAFPLPSGIEAPKRTKAKPKPAAKRDDAAERKAAREAQRQRLAELRAEVRDARRELNAATRARERAEREEASLRARVEELEAELEEAGSA